MTIWKSDERRRCSNLQHLWTLSLSTPYMEKKHNTWEKKVNMFWLYRGHYPVCAQILCKHWQFSIIKSLKSQILIHYERLCTPQTQAQPPDQITPSRSCSYVTWMMSGILLECWHIIRWGHVRIPGGACDFRLTFCILEDISDIIL